jgi:hypothetical protein
MLSFLKKESTPAESMQFLIHSCIFSVGLFSMEQRSQVNYTTRSSNGGLILMQLWDDLMEQGMQFFVKIY